MSKTVLAAVPTTPVQDTAEDPVADLISALLNDGIYDLAAHGLDPAKMIGHAKVHAFCTEYQQVTGTAPSPGEVLARFSDFPYNPAANLRWAVHQAQLHFMTVSVNRALTRMAQSMVDADPLGALSLMTQTVESTRLVSQVQPALVGDTSFYFEDPTPSCPVFGATLMKHTGGIVPGSIWYVASRPGRGKSWDLLNHALTAVENGWNARLFSLEMSARQMQFRAHTIITGGDMDMYSRARKVAQWNAEVRTGELEIYDPSHLRCDLTSIESLASPNTLFLVDYIGLMRTPEGERGVADHRNIAANSQGLKELALRRDIPIIAAAQLNRSAEEGKGSHRPSLNDLGGTDALGQDGDVVYFIRGHKGSRVRESYLLKNRLGPEGFAWYTEFNPSTGRFPEITQHKAEAILSTEHYDGIEF